MSAIIALPAYLTGEALAILQQTLLAESHVSQTVVLDGSEVSGLGTAGAQVLLALGLYLGASGRQYEIVRASDAMKQDASLLGLKEQIVFAKEPQ